MTAQKYLFTVLYLVLLGIINSKCELFTALSDLHRVLHAEHKVAQDLKLYIAQEEDRLGRLKAIASDFEEHSAAALIDPDTHLANPVNAFLLVKRFTLDWDNIIQNYIRSNATEVFLENVGDKTADFPSQDDLNGAATALLRLQDTYQLPTNKLASGEIQGVSISPMLSAKDCFEIGRVAYNKKDYYHTILWMEEAMQEMDREDIPSLLKADLLDYYAYASYVVGRNAYNQKDYYHTVLWMQEALDRLTKEGQPTVSKSSILDYLAFSLSMQGNVVKAFNLTKEWLSIEPEHVRAQNNLKYFEQQVEEKKDAARRQGRDINEEEELTNFKPYDDYRSSEEFTTYEALCRGESPFPVPNEHQLFCQFKRHHPMFYIDPLREEIANFDPWIVVYHNILNEKEIAKIKELAGPRLQRGTVIDSSGEMKTVQYRTSKSAWLRDYEDPLIHIVSQRTKAFTNLSLETVEELQVVNYGIGGHYEPHYDFARKEEVTSFAEKAGNRILTAIYYMSDVQAGGYTVFPQLGVKLRPEKGACAVWYNLLKSGEGDYTTRHAGCPVLTGSKWVCNKWFHERGQEFHRPCGLSPEE